MNDIIFIIPTIGRETLKKSIQSLVDLKGNYRWKAIIIFDGIKNNLISKHENLLILEVEKCGNIEKKNNAGLVRNIGLDYIQNNCSNLKSKYIGFLDDDDTIHPDYLINIYKQEELFNFEVIIHRMMYPNYKIVPHPLTRNIERCNVGISISFKYELIFNSKIRFINHPYEDYLFLTNIKREKYSILISEYVNYFVKTDYFNCKNYIKKYPNIYIR